MLLWISYTQEDQLARGWGSRWEKQRNDKQNHPASLVFPRMMESQVPGTSGPGHDPKPLGNPCGWDQGKEAWRTSSGEGHGNYESQEHGEG